MRRISQILSLLLAVLMTIGLFTGCKKEVTTEEIMKKYSDNYNGGYKEPAVVWTYGATDYDLFGVGGTYLDICNYGESIELSNFRVLSLEEFNTKAQAVIMSNAGPDLIISTNPDLLGDINKSLYSGAFMDYTKLIQDWNQDELFLQMLNGVASSKGKLYILPMCISTNFIITTRSKMEKYGFTEDDFSDFYKTTETILRLYEQTDESKDTYINVYQPDLIPLISDLFNYEKGKTTINNPKVQQLFSDWDVILQKKAERDEKTILIDDRMACRERDNRIIEFFDNVRVMSYFQQGYFNVNDDDLVIIPLKDTAGKVAGKIECYALISQNCKNKKAVENYLECLVYCIGRTEMGSKTRGDIGSKGSTYLLDGIHLTKVSSKILYRNRQTIEQTLNGSTWCDDYTDYLYSILKDTPMNLKVWSSPLREYSETITEYLQHPETADWEELERSINIYLSE